MSHYRSDSLSDIYGYFIDDLLYYTQFESSPRGKPIKEILVASFELTDPRNRIIESKAREMNYGFAVGELCWYLRGDVDLATMVYYNKRMSQFSDDGETINSAYGARILNPMWIDHTWSPKSQFENVVAELISDPDSRRAVMHINQPSDLLRAVTKGSKDVPCTMSLQLFIRERKLHMHVTMRSNDIIWGLPYDVFSFTCLMECFLYKLQNAGVPVDDLGSYHHTAGSLHIYDTHYDMANRIYCEDNEAPSPMNPFTLDGMEYLAEEIEPNIRLDKSNTITQPNNETELWMFNNLIDHRKKRANEVIEYERKQAALIELTKLSEEITLEKENNE